MFGIPKDEEIQVSIILKCKNARIRPDGKVWFDGSNKWVKCNCGDSMKKWSECAEFKINFNDKKLVCSKCGKEVPFKLKTVFKKGDWLPFKFSAIVDKNTFNKI